jgi:ATP-binding cassette, subfamily F, member 3
MVLLTVRDLTRQFDVEPVFSNVTFDVRAGEKVGIVGPNGAGKTTLMRILAGLDEPDIGKVERPGSVRYGFLEQRTEFPPGRTLIEEVRDGLAHLYWLQKEAHDLAARMADAAPDELEALHERYDQLHLELDRLDAYHVDHRVDEVLQGLGFAREDYERPLSTFSGGQQNRALLARLLLEAPDLMLLDEPTNHLDIGSTEWLEGFLSGTAQGVIVVSHDRYFLDRVTERTLEIYRGGVQDYPGNFSKYWSLRADRHEVIRRTWEKQQEYIAKTEDFIRRNQYGQKHAQAKDREKKLERLERVELPPEFTEIPMGFSEPSRTGDWVFRAEEVSKGFPATGPGNGEGRGVQSDESPTAGTGPLFEDLSIQIDRGDRVGILGPNGSGKTTLLRVLIGELAADTGTVRRGTGVQVGYFDQQLESVDPRIDAVEAVRPANRPEMTPGAIRGLLARFGIQGELALQTVGNMSGGERTKVALAKLAAEVPNVLVLDEPTNHLDFWACAALEKSLNEFPGTVLFVSHDRYFLDQVATKIISLDADRWWFYEGNYSGFQHFSSLRDSPSMTLQSETLRREETSLVTGSEPAPKPSSRTEAEPGKSGKPRRKRKFPYRKIEEIEEEITEIEQRIADLETEMADPETHRNAQRMRTIQQDYETTQSRLEELLEHWEEAAELN